ncbi:MAG: SpoIIE family protein phosphatase [Actinomycetota bacterium]
MPTTRGGGSDRSDDPSPTSLAALRRAHERERSARERAELTSHVVIELEECTTVAGQLTRLSELVVPRLADFITIESVADRTAFLARHEDPLKARVLDELRRRGSSPVADVDEREWRDGVARILPPPRQDVGSPGPGGSIPTVPSHDARSSAAITELQAALGARSRILLPLRTNEDPLAVVLGLTDPDRPTYTPEDLAFLRDFIERAGSVIAATEWREREQRASRRLQKALLPDVVAAHPACDVAAEYQAASDHVDVGGDWYDTFAWPDGRYALVVGDVVGHGVEAAAAMGRLRAGTEILVAEGATGPVEVLQAVARATRGHSIADYVTAVALVVDPERHELSYASAGHPPPIVIRSDGTTEFLAGGSVGPISPSIRTPTQSEAVPFRPDDVVVAYTDGLIERRHGDLAARFDRLAAAAGDAGDLDVADLARRLIDEMDADPNDDTVVAALRFAPHLRRHADQIEAAIEEVGAARDRLGVWLRSEDVADEIVEAVLLAATEALTNAAEHSSAGPNGGRVFVRASIDPRRRTVVVNVSDAGVWRRARLDPANRGRGTRIMRAVASDFERTTGPGGTAVTLRFDLAESAGSG